MAHGLIRINSRLLKYLMIEQDTSTMEILSSILEEAEGLIDIKNWNRCVSVENFFSLFQPFARQSKSICKLIEHSVDVWLMVVTLGQNLERKSKEYFSKNEIFRGYMLDRLGSFLVEEEMKKMDSAISKRCGANDATTHRYSPGYGDFSIKAQQVFLNLVKHDIPELKISFGYLLTPEKTVTAIKGVSDAGNIQAGIRGQDCVQAKQPYRKP